MYNNYNNEIFLYLVQEILEFLILDLEMLFNLHICTVYLKEKYT